MLIYRLRWISSVCIYVYIYTLWYYIRRSCAEAIFRYGPALAVVAVNLLPSPARSRGAKITYYIYIAPIRTYIYLWVMASTAMTPRTWVPLRIFAWKSYTDNGIYSRVISSVPIIVLAEFSIFVLQIAMHAWIITICYCLTTSVCTGIGHRVASTKIQRNLTVA